MPFISARVNCQVSPEKELKIKDELGKQISILPGKSERWLMCELSSDCHLYFQGRNDEKIAFISVRIYGGAEEKYYEKLTEAITCLFSAELDIPACNIYVQYEECQVWGWNGHNF